MLKLRKCIFWVFYDYLFGSKCFHFKYCYSQSYVWPTFEFSFWNHLSAAWCQNKCHFLYVSVHTKQLSELISEELILLLCTLKSGINVAPWINIAPGKFGKKNKRSPIYTLYLYYLNRLYGVPNKAVAPGKKSKN